MIDITKKQKQLYDEIKNFIQIKGYAPTIREMNELTNIKSTSTTYYKLFALKRKGYIDYVSYNSRTIRILK